MPGSAHTYLPKYLPNDREETSCSLYFGIKDVRWEQCDQIGQFIGFWASF